MPSTALIRSKNWLIIDHIYFANPFIVSNLIELNLPLEDQS